MGWGGLMGLGQGVENLGKMGEKSLREERIEQWRQDEKALDREFRADLQQSQNQAADARQVNADAAAAARVKAQQDGLMERQNAAVLTYEQGSDNIGAYQEDQHGKRSYHTGTGSSGSAGAATARMKEVRYYMANNPGTSFDEAWTKVNTNRNDSFTSFVGDAYQKHLKWAQENTEEPMPMDAFVDQQAELYDAAVSRRFNQSQPKTGAYSEAQQGLIDQVKSVNPGMSDADAANWIQSNHPQRWVK